MLEEITTRSDINIERFIDEVNLRTCIWDCTSEAYKDRNLKKRQWTELRNFFYPDFERSSAKQNAVLCK